ncbi:transcriptional regulator, Crp/Fnr family [[Synechococcus] sp. NIES-970]|uniref:Crp/Fnr family transcriptional regulator n=1 Tax=Picosynechococcus sp. NKBG15041c TaxID=1407650 RepID=UPI00056DEDE1|nr:Crp/Fnr family transcriptional regulator [Picosynechococcus sp. NKBG15041c]BAW96395.1 transcriptional regulator, Crp/Fnr family [[Synechococcus] sp. NIES-970]
MDFRGKVNYSFLRNQVIPCDSPDIWQVERGVVQLRSYTPEGTLTVLGWLQRGNFWGSFATRLDSIEAIALIDSSLVRYSPEVVKHSFACQQEILQQTLQRLRQTEYLLAIAGLKRIEDRLIALLLLLKEEMGLPGATMTRLRYRFTHQHLADTIGTTRVTVTRLFREFQDQGWLQLDGDRHILIPNDLEGDRLAFQKL